MTVDEVIALIRSRADLEARMTRIACDPAELDPARRIADELSFSENGDFSGVAWAIVVDALRHDEDGELLPLVFQLQKRREEEILSTQPNPDLPQDTPGSILARPPVNRSRGVSHYDERGRAVQLYGQKIFRRPDHSYRAR